MKSKGVTLVELLIVIVVMGIIASFSVVAIGNIRENTAAEVDQYNVEFLGDVINTAFIDGTLTFQSNRLYNTDSKRSYSGTGNYFYEDMDGYIKNRIRPVVPEAENPHNWAPGAGEYKLWFDCRPNQNEVDIYYWDTNRQKVVLFTVAIG